MAPPVPPSPTNLSPITFRHSVWDWSRPYVVGVLNLTPDSFSDGGRFVERDAALRAAEEMVGAAVDAIDVGGESTRPSGAAPVSAAEETDRVLPVIEELSATFEVPVSVDTTKAEVARAALTAGAEIVNDISGGAFDPQLPEVAADRGAAYICSHLRGSTLAEAHAAITSPPSFAELVAELRQIVAGLPAGLAGRVIVDPGLGFGKGLAENVELSARAGELSDELSCAVMVGPSRKRFLGELTGRPVDDRDGATVGAALAAVAGGAQIVRVHNVSLVTPALTVYCAIRERAVSERRAK